MKARGGGRIVNVSSAAGLRGFPLMAVYSATKFGLVGLTEALRVELRDSGVRVTLFCPGAVATPMMDKAFADPAQGRRYSKLAKTAEGCARKIADAVERGSPEVVYAEAPGAVYKTARFFPRLTDWLIYRIYLPLQEKFLKARPV
jgi:uncharacterized protein